MRSFAHRGMLLENVINRTAKTLHRTKTAIIEKKELPIVFRAVKTSSGAPVICEARLAGRSTTDYYGVWHGQFMAFEAKSTHEQALPFANIMLHQRLYLKQIEQCAGWAFYIVGFIAYEEFFAIECKIIEQYAQVQKSLSIHDARVCGFVLNLIYPGILDIERFFEWKTQLQ